MQKNDFNLVVNRIKSYNLLGVSKTVEKHKNSITKKWLGINVDDKFSGTKNV